jgi:hypothetical protein
MAGRERYLPAMFGRLHKKRKTPLNAMLLQAVLTIIFIVIGGGFRSLMTFSVVASWAFYFLTASLPPDASYVMLILVWIGARTSDLTCEGAPARKVSKVIAMWVFDVLTEVQAI